MTNGITPGMAVEANAIEDFGTARSELGGAGHMVEFKAHISTSDHNSDSTTRCNVGKARQEKANTAYYRATRDLDATVHNTPPDEQGPAERGMREYGQGGRALGPVVGVFESGSNDLGLLRDLASSEISRGHLRYHDMDIFQARIMLKDKLNRSWRQHIARGWASMLVDRLRDCIFATSPCAARLAHSDHYSPNSGEANDQSKHFRGFARGDNKGGWLSCLEFSVVVSSFPHLLSAAS